MTFTPAPFAIRFFLDAFKQGGNKFVKGKAITSTGESFTGSITHQTKDGKNIVSEYENGLIKKSTKYDGENILSQKEYSYEDGNLKRVLDKGDIVFNKEQLDEYTMIETKDGLNVFENNKLKYKCSNGTMTTYNDAGDIIQILPIEEPLLEGLEFNL